MKQRKFEVTCALLLGAAQLCVQTAFDAQGFVLESIIHSIHAREPQRIGLYDGYYGQAVIYASFLSTCLVTPSFLNVAAPKVVLVISAFCFAAFPIGFLFLNSYYFYFSTLLLGIGKAFFALGQTSYLTAHSTLQSIETNVSLSWAIGCSSFILGALILATITKLSSVETTEIANGSIEPHKFAREFSDVEIRLLAIVLLGVAALAVIITFFLPSKDVDDCIESSKKHGNFLEELKLTCSTFLTPKIVPLIPLTMLCGFNVSFFLSIFPTAMNFTKHNSDLIYISAVYRFGAGVGNVGMGVLVSRLSKRIKGFGLKPTMLIGALSVIAYCALVHVSTPFDALTRPTSEEPLLFYQSYPLIFLIAILCRISDCCINGVRSVICALVLPSRRAQSYAITRMYHSAACVIGFFFSPVTPLYFFTIGLPALSVFATCIFFRVADETRKTEVSFAQESIKDAETI